MILYSCLLIILMFTVFCVFHYLLKWSLYSQERELFIKFINYNNVDAKNILKSYNFESESVNEFFDMAKNYQNDNERVNKYFIKSKKYCPTADTCRKICIFINDLKGCASKKDIECVLSELHDINLNNVQDKEWMMCLTTILAICGIPAFMYYNFSLFWG